VITPIIADLGIGHRRLPVAGQPDRTLRDRRPMGDAGLTGRKIIVEHLAAATAGTGGGAFSGKDPSKSTARRVRAALGARCRCGKLASKVECAGRLRDRQGRAGGPVIETFGTETADPAKIAAAISERSTCGRPRSSRLDLKRPIYAQTAAYGHFGRELPTSPGAHDKAEQLAKLALG